MLRQFTKRLLIGSITGLLLMLGGALVWPVLHQSYVMLSQAQDLGNNEELVDDEAPPLPELQEIGRTPIPEGVVPEGGARVPAVETSSPPDLSPAGVLTVPVTAPPLKEMLKVEVSGPMDGMRGDKAYFRATVSGKPEYVSWEISPKVSGLDVLADHLSSSFSNREPGIYTIRCVVSGPGGHATSEAEYEILADPEPPVVAQPTQPTHPVNPTQPMQMLQQQATAPPGTVSWPDGVKLLASRVGSNTKRAEGMTLAGSFRMVSNRVKVGTILGEDPWMACRKQSQEALGDAFGPWEVFFRDLFALVGGLKQQGLLTTPQQNTLFLDATAEALGNL